MTAFTAIIDSEWEMRENSTEEGVKSGKLTKIDNCV
jgi:hypothetical protein